jgi:hypothetical protein
MTRRRLISMGLLVLALSAAAALFVYQATVWGVP